MLREEKTTVNERSIGDRVRIVADEQRWFNIVGLLTIEMEVCALGIEFATSLYEIKFVGRA